MKKSKILKVIDFSGAIVKTQKLRKTGPDLLYYEVGFPREIVEREATSEGMSVEKYANSHCVELHMGAFPGVYYRLVKNNGKS